MKNFSIVDEKGNINTSVLEKELISSLAHDIKYKQTDNMKKVIVKISLFTQFTDYNFFRRELVKSQPIITNSKIWLHVLI